MIADDAAEVRAILRAELSLSGGFEVVGEASTGEEAVALAADLAPDLVLLDVSMPGIDGLEAIAPILERSPASRVVMFSGFEERGLADAALRAGASGFLPKSTPIEELPSRLLDLMAAASMTGVAAVDETSPKAPAEVLSHHLERFRSFFDEADIGMATMTLGGRIARANRALAHLCGRELPALVGTPYVSLVGASHATEVRTTLATVAATGEVAQLEHPFDGASDRWGALSLRAVADESGRPLYLFAQVADVSAHRRTTAALLESEGMFRLLVGAVNDYAIFMLDPTGHIVSWNRGAQRIKGYQADEIIGRHFSVFYTEADRLRHHPEHELELAARDGSYEEEGIRLRKDGSQFWANVLITAVRDAEGELRGFAKVTRDITERRVIGAQQAEAARRIADANTTLRAAIEQKAEFLAVTAHELRTPIAVVGGFAALLSSNWEQLNDVDREEMLEAIRSGADRLSKLVDDLRVVARLEVEAIDVRPEPVQLVEAVRRARRDLDEASRRAVEVDAAEDLVVLVDQGHLQRILANYLNNAFQHGHPPVRVAIEAKGDQAVVRVRDAGGGVSASLEERLFQRFGRGEGSGSGLGLFIVRNLARGAGGDAWYDANERAFAFSLPLAS